MKLTSKELDTRRYANRIRDAYTLTEAEGILKQFGKDCIEAVTPDRKDAQAWYEGWNKDTAVGFNRSIDTIEANTKEILG